jgi:hypothetical protein
VNPSDDSLTNFWLLNTAIEFPRSLGYIFPSIQGLALNMPQIPGCEPEDYARSLIDLFESGFVIFRSDFQEDDVINSSGVSRIIERYVQLPESEASVKFLRSSPSGQHASAPRKKVTFQLTETGGVEWGKYAKPDWHRFFGQFTTPSESMESGEVEMFSQNLDLLMAILGWFQESDEGRADLGSIEVQKHQEFPILYWKRLPSVYRITFRIERAEARWSGDGPHWLLEPKWFREWWRSTRVWYTEPWELPIWPTA